MRQPSTPREVMWKKPFGSCRRGRRGTLLSTVAAAFDSWAEIVTLLLQGLSLGRVLDSAASVRVRGAADRAPGKIVCVGLNYRDHAEEQGAPLPEAPLLFAKWQNTLIGPGEPIVIPPIVTKCDYEAELGVVIGATRPRRLGRERARGRRAATSASTTSRPATCSSRDGQWTRGKSPDTFCPVGPELVPADEVPDPQALSIRAILNGEVDAGLDDREHGLRRRRADRVHHAAITLEPGDLIATGTPAGVGAFRKPPVFMQPGDEITIEIEGLGSLTNPVVAG